MGWIATGAIEVRGNRFFDTRYSLTVRCRLIPFAMLSLTALLLAYIFGGLTLLPLLRAAAAALIYYASPPSGGVLVNKDGDKLDEATAALQKRDSTSTRIYRSGWLNVRRTFEAIPDSWGPKTGAATSEGSCMTLLAFSYRSFMDSRSKGPKKSKPEDRLFAVLKDSVLILV